MPRQATLAMWLPQEGLRERGRETWGCRGAEKCGARERVRLKERDEMDGHEEGRGTAQGGELLGTMSWSLWTPELPSRAL